MESNDPRLLRRSDGLAHGYSDDELRRWCRNGALTRLRPGVYASSEDMARLDFAERHRVVARATVQGLHTDAVLSHISAAAIYGLPIWNVDLSKVHVTRSGATARSSSRIRTHAVGIAPDQIRIVDGLRVTTPARTIVDLGRLLPFEQAVVIGDAATRLEEGAVDVAPERHRHRRGAGAARRVVSFVDGRSESVGESRSRVAIHVAGLPAPSLQIDVLSVLGGWLARVDFLWEQFGVIGEFDGLGKYVRHLAPGQTPGDVVVAEKLREDGLRAAGWTVVRWTWSDLAEPAAFLERLRRAFATGSPRPSPTRPG
ncbi:type IV toxin-antitoxin system AbiEi family antitoxin domain-containing protein [Antrihabitans sp. YC3-6]|uniref:Type IV toxin-antitoxin system AbiEi family antitoxin domain-containing protein n=1 Tax=Antrihabitans stalagmiti TaxID=2799499 RepID=A0A934NRT6_9NOCA|nr:type IV toxin-antitoxin system AbiEi family antitoxin domain-containing protein [Antrihabitans stalagmiti]MBJ8340055.1 type IV toxin-antitoxin system AbiEi family antitoxin domain-containing protein [Antrihabitans stalagmiti]